MKNTKKILWLLLLLSTACPMEAQTPGGGFLYTDFEPDLEIDEGTNHTDTIEMDFDRDGSPDFIAYYRSYSMGARYFYFEPIKSNWEMSWFDETDSLTNPHIRWWNITTFFAPYPDGTDRWGVRCRVGDDFYYGWMQLYCINELGLGGRYYLVLDKMLFCTIPNYPLVWGQTTSIGSIEETTGLLYPNPTDGFVTVTMKNLRRVEIVNLLGQCVVEVQGEGDQYRVDISCLPPGVYFVSVSDTGGRRSIHKVVKE